MKTRPPTKPRNSDRRSREYLTPDEIGKLIAAAGKLGRHGHRDSTMILVGYRHGLRVSELVSLRWGQIDLDTGLIKVSRLKNGLSCEHPLFGPEIRALRKLKRDSGESPYVFNTERKGPITVATFRKLLTRAGENANIEISVHPHMLRHSTGHKLASAGADTRSIQLYLGHRNIQHTAKYFELSTEKFSGFWQD
jgi:type 1 fimbriae regulatory protein FimB/type 1 fimbriae regulatory protein FimE